MNYFIIQTLRNKTKLMGHQLAGKEGRGQSQGQGQGQNTKTVVQIYVILLLVTFSFLILTTPGYVILLYIMRVDYEKSPEAFAEFYLLDNIGQKTYYTNCGINFFLYVVSGRKFRTDLVRLFKCRKDKSIDNSVTSETITRFSSVESR